MKNVIKKVGKYGKTEATMLRIAVYLIGASLLAVCFILIPELAREESAQHPDAVTFPYIIGAYFLTTPVFYALYQVHKIAGLIDKENAITADFVSSLRSIKYSAIVFSALVVLGTAVIVIEARANNPGEDVTHIFALGFIFTFASSVIATIVALFQSLIQNAVELKSENELTV